MKYKFGELGDRTERVWDRSEDGSINWSSGRDVPVPHYDAIIELSIARSGKHRGMVKVEIGREPQEGFRSQYRQSSYSRVGKRSVKTGYVPIEMLRQFVEENS
jgi:hypothetical protein